MKLPLGTHVTFSCPEYPRRMFGQVTGHGHGNQRGLVFILGKFGLGQCYRETIRIVKAKVKRGK